MLLQRHKPQPPWAKVADPVLAPILKDLYEGVIPEARVLKIEARLTAIEKRLTVLETP